MGFPHCPICVILAFTSVLIGITRSYMFFILFREFMREEFRPNLNLNFT